MFARDEALKLENEYKELVEKTAAAKKASEDAKKIVKDLKISSGAGSELEAESAEDDLGVTTSDPPVKKEGAAQSGNGTGISIV